MIEILIIRHTDVNEDPSHGAVNHTWWCCDNTNDEKVDDDKGDAEYEEEGVEVDADDVCDDDE